MADRFMMFIDGSNLHGVSLTLELKFPVYGTLIQHLFKASTAQWQHSFVGQEGATPARFIRAYYYGVGSIDEWDFDDPTTIRVLRSLFDKNRKVSDFWQTLAQQDSTDNQFNAGIHEQAWNLFLGETRRWYNAKLESFDGNQRFLHSLESNTDFIEVNRDGHWKLDLLNHTAHEKGVDTGFSVDMVTMTAAYDVAILVSGDSDGIPAIRNVKRDGRQVGVIDFYQEDAPDRRGPNLSKALRREVDFITSVSDTELLAENVGVSKAQVSRNSA